MPVQRGQAQVATNQRLWQSGKLLRQYANRDLRPPEVILLARYASALSGSVLELGCGAGRLSGYLVELATDFRGIDIAEPMLAYCRQRYPDGSFERVDLGELVHYDDSSFDAVVAPFNVLDVLDEAKRVDAITEVHRISRPGGLLIMSSHNLAHASRIPPPTKLALDDPLKLAKQLIRLPRRLRNRRRLLGRQHFDSDHAILVDPAHDYSLLHHYIDRGGQERQFRALGFELLECLDLDGRIVGGDDRAAEHPELHYVARALPGTARTPDAIASPERLST